MTVGEPYKLLINFALPLLFGNLFQQLYNTADSVIVGNLIGTKALAAVGAGFPFFMILTAVFMGIGIAATVLVSQAMGAKDYERANLIINTIYKVSLIAIVPLTLIGYFSTDAALRLINVPDDGTFVMAADYLRVLFLGMVCTMGFNMNSGILQGLGDSVTSLKYLILSTILNIGLDLLLAGPAGMGVAGAALATVLAQLVSWVLGLRFLNKHFPNIKLNLFKLDFDKDIFKRASEIALPSAIQNALFSMGIMAMMGLIGSYGSNFMAGYNVANKIDTLIYFPILSLASATTTFIGQNVGAKKMDRIYEGLKKSLVLSVASTVSMALLMYPFLRPMIEFFIGSKDPLPVRLEVIDAALNYLDSVLPFYFLMGTLFTFNAVLRGVGQGYIPMFATLCALWVARVPTAYFIASRWGKEYIYYSSGIGWILGNLASGGYYFSMRWKEKLDFS